MYATLGSIAPVMEELKGKVHPLSAFAALLDPDKGVPAGAVASDDEDGSDEPF
jgi:hypothetical protein